LGGAGGGRILELMTIVEERMAGLGPDCLMVETDSQGRISSLDTLEAAIPEKEESDVAGEETTEGVRLSEEEVVVGVEDWKEEGEVDPSGMVVVVEVRKEDE